MGKRSRGKSRKSGSKPGAQGASRTRAPPRVEEQADIDVADDILAYESPDSDVVARAAAAAGSDSESSGADVGTDEELLAATGAHDDGDGSDVEVTFDFHDPSKGDAPALAALLAAQAAPCGLDARAMADTVCAQTRVGTIVRVDGGAAPVAVISALELCTHRKLLAPLLPRLSPLGPTVAAALAGKGAARVALVVAARVLNLPPQLAPKMLEALLCELEWATEDEPTPQLRAAFDIRWFIYLAEVYPAAARDAAPASAAPPKKKTRGGTGKGAPEIAFTRPEDELFLAAATRTVTWQISADTAAPDGFTRRMMAMLITKKQMDDAFERVKSLFAAAVDAHDEMADAHSAA